MTRHSYRDHADMTLAAQQRERVNAALAAHDKRKRERAAANRRAKYAVIAILASIPAFLFILATQ